MTTSSGGGTLQLEQWATSLAPLTEVQRASVSRLEQWCSSKQRATSKTIVVSSSGTASRAGTPAPADSVRAGTPFTASADEVALPAGPVADPSAFLTWYSSLSRKLDTSTQSSHRAALQAIKSSADDADALLDDLERARVNVAELRAGVRFVEEGSEGLRDVAEGILEKMDHLTSLTNDVAIRLSYFDILPPATALLSMPSLSVVTSPDFLYTLDRLDVGLEFMRAHSHYRDAGLYTMRFEQCLTRAGTLIRLHFVAKMSELQTAATAAAKEIENDIGIKRARLIADKGGVGDDMLDFALPEVRAYLYDAFDREAPHLGVLLAELAKRATSSLSKPALIADEKLPSSPTAPPNDNRNAEEFDSLLSECRKAYLSTRHALILPIVQACATHLETANAVVGKQTPTSETLGALQYLRRSFAMLKLMSVEERRLYVAIFGAQDQQELASHLELVAEPLWTHLRPTIQRETALEPLSTLCGGILRLLAEPAAPDDTSSDSRLSLAPILQQWVQEVQNRLFVRARAIAASDISKYAPKDAELDYPARLEVSDASHARGKSLGGAGLLEAAAVAPGSTSSAVRLFTAPPPHILGTWYVPLRRTLDLLSHLHQRVRTSDFVPFANSTIEACREVLLRDTATLVSKVGMGESGVHPHLFALRHLLLLREMSASVELCKASAGTSEVDKLALAASGGKAQAQGGTAIDFSSVVDALNALWAGTGALLDPRNLYTLATGGAAGTAAAPVAPSGTATEKPRESSPSSPSSLEQDIQRSSTAVADWVTSSATLPLRIFVDQSKKSTVDASKEGAVMTTPDSSSAPQAEKARAAFEAFRICVQSTLEEALAAMRLYLEDEATVQSLVGPTLALILQKYAAFETLVVEAHGRKAPLEDLPTEEELRGELDRKTSGKVGDGFGSYVT